jgi:hypothetical protein
MEGTPVNDLEGWLAELRFQQRHRSHEITGDELRTSWDRYLDAYLDARKAGSMTDAKHPAGEPLIGHITLSTGELVTVQVTDNRVVLALYAIPEETGSADDTHVQPAPVMALDPDEAEVLGTLVTYAAVAAYSQQRPPPHQETLENPPAPSS